jgi:hypothetical protein
MSPISRVRLNANVAAISVWRNQNDFCGISQADFDIIV